MTTSFVGITSVHVTSTAFTINTPADSEGNAVQENDLLYLVAITDAGVTLTPPDSTWKQHTTFTLGAIAGVTWFKYAVEDEVASFAWSMSAFTANRWTVLAAYRGVKQDTSFNPGLYPFGFFAPGGGTTSANTGTSTSITSQTGGNPHTFVTFSRVFYFFAQYDSAAGNPYLDDDAQDIDLQYRAADSRIALMVMDHEEPTLVSPAAQVSVNTSTSKPWVALAVVFEPLSGSAGADDNYKAKIMRHMLPPPYNQDFSSTISKVLTTIGQSDNLIGGLFGDADFLPDEG